MSLRPHPRTVAAATTAVALLAVTTGLVSRAEHNGADAAQARTQRAVDRLIEQRSAQLATLADTVQPEFTDRHRTAHGVMASLDVATFGGRAVLDSRLAIRLPHLASGGPLDLETLRGEEIRRTASAATDRGSPLAVVTPVTHGRAIVVLWPLYDGALPATTAGRRALQAGWALAVVHPSWLVDPAVQTARALGYGTVVVGPLPASSGLPGTVVDDAVAVRVVPGGPGRPLLGWVLLTALAIAVAGGLALATRRRNERDRARSDAESLREQIRLLADLGVTAQETLDVSLTLPAILLQLSSRLRLDYVAVMTGSEPQLVQLLALGSRPSASMTLRFPLHHSLRTVGVLEISRSSPVTTTEQETVQAIADVIAGSLFNSDLFEREQAAVQRLQDVDRLKDDFLGTVSHELRTPLSILVGYSAMLRKRWETMAEPDKLAAVTTIETHVGALTNLVNDLLDFVTDRNSAQHVNLTPVRLAVPVRELVERYRPLLGRHELSMDLDEAAEVITDARAVERILTNLLSNASKYSPAGTLIALTVRNGEEGVSLGVRDHGPGIADTDRALIFERFYRGTTDAARSTRGTGIGLTIVRTWLEMVGARLEIRSQLGVGTHMSVVFPRPDQAALPEAGQIVWREEHLPIARGTVQA